MVAIKLLVLSLACVFATAVPRTPPVTRNTIFQDERFKGEVFEDVDAFDSIELSRNEVVSPYRLPTTTKPSHYDVLWIINIANLAYSGSVNMTIHSTRANVSEIVVHCDHITPSSVVLTLGTTVVPTTYRLQEEYQFLIITVTNGVLQYNENNQVDYTLLIQFNETPMREDMYGIYKSWFRNSFTDTQVSWMATTQFQATAARYAFPCYDEPSFKATFDITIRRPTTHRSWSCTRLRETRNTVFTGYQEDVFYTTPVMSTYLLALIVAEYNSIEATSNGLLMHEVIARPGALSAGQGAYAQTTGQALLAEMNDHTAYNFYQQNSNLKMTQAAIPDFGAGAMENWGLLTYREAYLMYDEAHTNSYFKQLIAYILSHEIAHMWFGNLVTNDWWDVLWLNEGFARYYQYFLTYWVEDMGLATRFITEQVHTSLLSDSANNPQPLTNPGVGSPAAVSAMFSTITYNKGAAVIRMTEHLLGFEVHRAGLRNYLQSRQFNTSLPSHLFNALALAGNEAGALTAYGSDFDFSEYYKSWTEQPGHPVLNVQVNHTTGEMIIYQRRFNINTGYSSINTNYIVPITFTTGASPNFVNTKPSHVLSKAITVINRGVVGDHWVLFNIQQTGFYRVNYDDYTWDLIILALRGSDRTLIHEYNRAQIVNDVFQFARSGLMSYERAFNILSFLEFETEYAPWVAALTGFSWLRNRLAGTPQLTELNNLLVRWANTAITQLTYYPTANESFMRSYLRYQLAPVLCNIGVQACRQAATAQFNALRDTGVEVPVDSRNWVYCNALRDGTQADFNFLWTRFQQHNVYTEKILLLQTLGCTPHEASLNILLNNIVQDNYVIRPQDYTTAMNTVVTGNEGNTQIAFTYMRNNLAAVTSAFGSPVTPLSYVSARLRTINEVNEFQAWATANQAALGDSYTAVYNGAENSRQSILWASEVQNDMNTYFVNGNQNIQASTPAAPVEVTVVTTPRPTLVEPVAPDLPALADSASTTFVSIFVVALAAIANYML